MPDIEKPTALDVARLAVRTGIAEPAMRLGDLAAAMGGRAAMMNPELAAQVIRRAQQDTPWQGRDGMRWRQGWQMPWRARGRMGSWSGRRMTPWQGSRWMPFVALTGLWMRQKRAKMRWQRDWGTPAQWQRMLMAWQDWEPPLRRQRRNRRARGWQLILAAVAGAFVAYMLDPEHGNRRRKMAAQRTTHFARQGARELGKASRYMGNTLAGKREMLMRGGRWREPLDDATLAHKVESVLFRDPHVPKGNINVNSEHGVVVLRGEVQTPDEIREIERRVRGIEGVQEVRSMLHSQHAAS